VFNEIFDSLNHINERRSRIIPSLYIDNAWNLPALKHEKFSSEIESRGKIEVMNKAVVSNDTQGIPFPIPDDDYLFWGWRMY